MITIKAGRSSSRMLAGLTILVMVLSMATTVSGDDTLPGLVTDRPDFTESGVVVPRGHIQFEGGMSWFRLDEEMDTLSGPEMLVRWTILNRLELRFGIPDYIDVDVPDGPSGFGDSSFGTKIQIGPLGDAWDVAAIATLSLPTGEDDLTSDAYDPDFILTIGRDLGRIFSVGTQFSAGWPTEGDERTFLWGGTFVVGASFCERFGTFVEVAYEIPEEGDEPVVFHHGYTMMVGDNLQFDIHGGTGLNDAAPDFFLGGGLSFRI